VLVFKVLGGLLALYVLLSLTTGTVYARSGLRGRTYRRDEDAPDYWTAIVGYAVLTLALLFWF
jgi:hypothetical protein